MFAYKNPNEFNKLLTENGLIDDIYEALEQDNKGDAVMVALEILKKTNTMPTITKVSKMEDVSRYFRNLADESLDSEDYRNAFDFYNQALLCAPKDSFDLLLQAYFGRVRMLFKKNCLEACIADIDRCLAWNHPDYQPKLKEMKAICQKNIKAALVPIRNHFMDNFFFNIGQTHPKVPCVSAAADFTIENGQPKVVSRRNISIGTLVALETAYVCHLDERNQIRACHFCHALSLNLIPCDSCRYILFCSEKCKKLCWEEYHNVECHIIHVLEATNVDHAIFPLTVRAALKLKNVCTWEEFKSISSDLGLKEMKSSMINEIYDVNNKVSILRCNGDRSFVFGQTYNAVFIYATIIHYLESVPSFFPNDVKAKNEAIRALSRVLAHLNRAFGHITRINNSAKNSADELSISNVQEINYGLFSFTSKLKHSCDPNLFVVGLNNKVALLAIRPIKSGEEFKISYIGHWYDTLYADRALRMFLDSEIACRCPVCVEGWSAFSLPKASMNEQQKQSYDKWNRIKCAYFLGMVDMGTLYKESCYCYSALQNLPNTMEHREVFDELRRSIIILQDRATKNCSVLDPVKKEILRPMWERR